MVICDIFAENVDPGREVCPGGQASKVGDTSSQACRGENTYLRGERTDAVHDGLFFVSRADGGRTSLRWKIGSEDPGPGPGC